MAGPKDQAGPRMLLLCWPSGLVCLSAHLLFLGIVPVAAVPVVAAVVRVAPVAAAAAAVTSAAWGKCSCV